MKTGNVIEIVASLVIACGIGAVTVSNVIQYWIASSSTYSGLYYQCSVSGGNCSFIVWEFYASSLPYDIMLLACRVCFIVSGGFILIAIICQLISACLENRYCIVMTAGILYLVAGLFALLGGSSVYTAATYLFLFPTSSVNYTFGYCFWLAWGGGGVLLIMSIFLIYAGSTLKIRINPAGQQPPYNPYNQPIQRVSSIGGSLQSPLHNYQQPPAY